MRGFGVVEYESAEQAEAVLIEMDRTLVGGQEVRLSLCTPGTSGRSTLAALIAAQGMVSARLGSHDPQASRRCDRASVDLSAGPPPACCCSQAPAGGSFSSRRPPALLRLCFCVFLYVPLLPVHQLSALVLLVWSSGLLSSCQQLSVEGRT